MYVLDSGPDHRHHKERKTEVWFALVLDSKYSWDVSLHPALVRPSVFISSVCRTLSLSLAEYISKENIRYDNRTLLSDWFNRGRGLSLIFQVMSSPHPPNRLTEWRRDVELIYCGETGRADLHKMNAKLSPKDGAHTPYKRSNLPAHAHSWTVFLL